MSDGDHISIKWRNGNFTYAMLIGRRRAGHVAGEGRRGGLGGVVSAGGKVNQDAGHVGLQGSAN